MILLVLTSSGQAGSLDLGSELDRSVEFHDGHIVVEREDVETSVSANLLYLAHLLVVLGYVVAAQEHLQLIWLKRLDTMRSSEHMAVSDQSATAVELSLTLESDNPWELSGCCLLAAHNSIVATTNATHLKRKKGFD